MKTIKNSKLFNTEILIHIGLLLTSIFNLVTFLFAVYYYSNGNIYNAIFWAVMLVSSEVGHAGFKLEKSKLQSTNSSYTTNVTLDLSKMNNSTEFIESLKKQINTKQTI